MQICCHLAWASLQKQILGQDLSIGNNEKLKVNLGCQSCFIFVPFQAGLLNVVVYLYPDLEPARTSSGDLDVAKKTKKKRGKEEPDIDFTKALEHEMANVFAPPKNPKSLLLPANKGSCNNKLPEDCHYQPESLVKLFLLPDVLVMLTFHENYS